MKKAHTQKGITLIALIITIVVLLILAVVTINAIQGDGIIQYAKNASDEYTKKADEEQTILSELEEYLAETAGPWVQEKTVVKNIKTGATLNVGDTVAYDETKNGTVTVPVDVNWKVLGAKNGEVLLMSTADVGTVELYGADDYYNNVGIGKINAACSAYAGGNGALSVRSINVEDVNRITGYDPTNQINGKVYGAGQVYEYGNVVTYTLGADGDTVTVTVEGKPDLKSTFSLNDDYGGPFYKPDGTTLKAGESYEAEQNTHYYYQASKYLTNTTKDPAYAMLFRNEANTSNVSYWLGSSYVYAHPYNAFFGVRLVYDGNVGHNDLWSSGSGDHGSRSCGVRAVVSLKSDVIFTPNGANSWEI